MMSQGTTILIVSYHYAPSPTVGAKRFSFLAREFERLGYKVHVIADGPHNPALGDADRSLPVADHVHYCSQKVRLPLSGLGLPARAGNAVARRLLAPVGLEFFWARHAVRAAPDLVGSTQRGVVIATVPPPAALIAGERIACRLGWPLIIDYRDPWSAFNWPSWHRGRIRLWFARRLENYYVKRSSARILNTPAVREWFERYFPAAPTSRNFVIPNGFDAVPPAPSPPDTGPLEIVHAGSLYTGRSLLPILQAAARLTARYPERSIRVISYGGLPSTERQRIHAAGVEQFLEIRKRVPWASLFTHLQRAHVLLAVVGEHMAYSAPYKVYDYLAAARPILALAPEGSSLHQFIADTGAGLCVDHGDIDAVEHALEELLFDSARCVERGRVERCLWSNLALQYSAVIDSLLGKRTGSAAEPVQPSQQYEPESQE